LADTVAVETSDLDAKLHELARIEVAERGPQAMKLAKEAQVAEKLNRTRVSMNS